MALIIVNQFGGGISPSSKTGPTNSARFIRFMDIYTDADAMTPNPRAVKESGTVVSDLVKWSTDTFPFTTDKYFYGDTGRLYKRTVTPAWTVARIVSGTNNNGVAYVSSGQGLAVMDDFLYYTTDITLGRYGRLSNSPTFSDDYINSVGLDLDQSSALTGQTYTTPVAISEAATALLSMTPLYEPIITISFYVVAKGSGDWTVTAHDSGNRVLGTATIANASLTNGAYNNFNFSTSTPVRFALGTTIHFHVTSTVADGTLQTGTTADLSTAAFNEYFCLVPDPAYHPMVIHTNGVTGIVVVGNEHYLGFYDSTTFNPNKITLEPGYKVRFFTKENEFVVAWAWKGTNIFDFEFGKMFYWDGIQSYYNYSVPITGGSPNAAINFKNRELSMIGSTGYMNLGSTPFRLIQPAPQLVSGQTVEVMPGAMTVWHTRAEIGIGANATDEVGLEQGVYTFGNQTDRAITYQSVSTEVLNFGYKISTGTTQSLTMAIGLVAAYGNNMFIGWKDASDYGVDVVNLNNNPAPTGSWESLILDQTADENGQLTPAPQKEKEAQRLVLSFITLPAGVTITPKYKKDRASVWTYGTPAGVGDTDVVMDINQRYKEIEVGLDSTATTNYFKVTGIILEFDPLLGERPTPNG